MSVETINNRATLDVLDALSLLKFINMMMVTDFQKQVEKQQAFFKFLLVT
jgi:hypothetical protein